MGLFGALSEIKAINDSLKHIPRAHVC